MSKPHVQLREFYQISPEDCREANQYAIMAAKYTSDRHDFHSGSFEDKRIKMFEGKMGEKAFEMFLRDNHVRYIPDRTSYMQKDDFDFLIWNTDHQCFTLDVKTRTKHYHTRTLEMVEQMQKTTPKDIYVSTRLYLDTNRVKLLGWFSRKEMLQIGRIENNGYKDNYVIFDSELHPMEELYSKCLVKFLETSPLSVKSA